jgi:hypothetical protein
MPPPHSTTHSPNHYFDNAYPLKLTTLRPSTWYALESFLELLITAYCLWAAFYLVYISMCCAVWVAKGVRKWMSSLWMGGWQNDKKAGYDDERRKDCGRWWWKMKGRDENTTKGNMVGDDRWKGDGLNGVYDYHGKIRMRRRTV